MAHSVQAGCMAQHRAEAQNGALQTGRPPSSRMTCWREVSLVRAAGKASASSGQSTSVSTGPQGREEGTGRRAGLQSHLITAGRALGPEHLLSLRLRR